MQRAHSCACTRTEESKKLPTLFPTCQRWYRIPFLHACLGYEMKFCALIRYEPCLPRQQPHLQKQRGFGTEVWLNLVTQVLPPPCQQLPPPQHWFGHLPVCTEQHVPGHRSTRCWAHNHRTWRMQCTALSEGSCTSCGSLLCMQKQLLQSPSNYSLARGHTTGHFISILMHIQIQILASEFPQASPCFHRYVIQESLFTAEKVTGGVYHSPHSVSAPRLPGEHNSCFFVAEFITAVRASQTAYRQQQVIA